MAGFNNNPFNISPFDGEYGGARPDGSPYITYARVERGIEDTMWKATINAAGFHDPGYPIASWSIRMPDYQVPPVYHLVFHGVVPSPNYKVQIGKMFSEYSAFSYAFYLTMQHLTLIQRKTMAVNNTGSNIDPGGFFIQQTDLTPGDWTYASPRLYMTDLLTGTGLTAGSIEDSVDYLAGTIVQRSFNEFVANTSKYEAAKAMADYINFLTIDSFLDSPARNVFHFIPQDISDASLDTYLGLPSPVTFTYPSPYVAGEIEIEQKYQDVYNRIVVRGHPEQRTEKLTNLDGVTTITLAEPAIYGTVGLSYNTGGDALDVTDLIVENGSETTATTQIGIGMITFTETDVVKMSYIPAVNYYVDGTTYYESLWESAGVIAGTEYAIEAPPYDSQNLKSQTACDDYLALLQEYYWQANANVYTIKFKRRPDLKLLQRISFSGWDYVTTETLRITRIVYEQRGSDVTVTVEATSAQRFKLQMQLQKIGNLNMLSAAQIISNAAMKKVLVDEACKVLVTTGTTAIVQDSTGVVKEVIIR
jgi:hypothetical protein